MQDPIVVAVPLKEVTLCTVLLKKEHLMRLLMLHV